MPAKFLPNPKDGALILKTLKKYELANINSSKFEITRIASGAINQNFKVVDETKAFLLKVFSSNTVLPINRRGVFNMQEELSILGLAPQPLFLSEDSKIYCEQWIDVASASQKDNQSQIEPCPIDLLAQTLFSVHNSYVSAQLVALDKHWEIYWQKVKHPSLELQEKYTRAKQQWHQYLEKNLDQFVLCHNDLHIDHISSANGPIFDWEYAGLGCRYFDIANCCAINQLNEAEIASLCSRYAYFANEDKIDVSHKVQQMSVLSAFTEQLWSLSLGICLEST